LLPGALGMMHATNIVAGPILPITEIGRLDRGDPGGSDLLWSGAPSNRGRTGRSLELTALDRR